MTACNDDLLDTVPQTSIPEEEAYNTPGKVLAQVNNLYKQFFFNIGLTYQQFNGNFFSEIIINKNRTLLNNFYLKEKHSELCRINAINRQLAINEDANYLRSLGDVFITEPRNAGKLMKRAKETTVNSKGKINKKKRFGKSIKNRCPSGF